MCSEIAIKVENLGKCYPIYDSPRDRLKQFLFPLIRRLLGLPEKNHYRPFWALQDLSFEIRKGQTVGIIGRNGSGKSTLLQLICGTLDASSGSLRSCGRIAALLELGAGFNPEFSGAENVRMAAALHGLSATEIEARFDDIAAFADIGEHLTQPVRTYSSGMYVRLAFAVIAHVDADILVIDEALAVGDAFFTQKCMRFLRDFMKKGTVLFVSHDSGAIVNLCDSVIWLDHGRLQARGDPKTISESYLASFYGVSCQPREPVDAAQAAAHPTIQHDPRWTEINASALCNRIEVFSFDLEQARGFGDGDAVIEHVRLQDLRGRDMLQCMGGEVVELLISIRACADLDSPIVGFSLKDRLGQVLFGDNTYLSYRQQRLRIDKDARFIARFRFQLPILPRGDYSISPAIATGTQEDHRQQHWIHDALILKSLSSSVSTGLVGVPMQAIRIEIPEHP